jgi:hypothetical protein
MGEDPNVHIFVVKQGDFDYRALMNWMRLPSLVREAAANADFWIDEHPDKVWIIAADVRLGMIRAFCAYEHSRVPGIDVQLVDGYEVSWSWDDDYYQVVHMVRDELVRGFSCAAFIYIDPWDLYPESQGWQMVDSGATDDDMKEWYLVTTPCLTV